MNDNDYMSKYKLNSIVSSFNSCVTYYYSLKSLKSNLFPIFFLFSLKNSLFFNININKPERPFFIYTFCFVVVVVVVFKYLNSD